MDTFTKFNIFGIPTGFQDKFHREFNVFGIPNSLQYQYFWDTLQGKFPKNLNNQSNLWYNI